jgi:elongator complex protein 1
MDTDFSRFAIDDYLKRYESALLHLTLCGPQKTFDHVLAYIKKHDLHREGMKLYKSLRDQHDVSTPSNLLIQAILGMYADCLADKNQHADAALGMSLSYLIVAYELVGEKEKAVESYTKAGLWRESLNIAYSIPMPTAKIAQLADRLAESLVSRREFADAATVYIEYGKDDAAISKAVNALASGYQFTEAIRIVNLFGVI